MAMGDASEEVMPQAEAEPNAAGRTP